MNNFKKPLNKPITKSKFNSIPKSTSSSSNSTTSKISQNEVKSPDPPNLVSPTTHIVDISPSPLILNPLSLLFATYSQQNQSPTIKNKLLSRFCPQEKQTLAQLAALKQQQSKGIKTSQSASTSACSDPTQIQLRYDPLQLRSSPTPSSISKQNQAKGNESNSNPMPVPINTSIYASSPLQQHDPILIYYVSQQLYHLTTEQSLLTFMTHKHRSQLRRQTYFSWINRVIRKVNNISSSLQTFLASNYTLIYTLFDAMSNEQTQAKLAKAKGVPFALSGDANGEKALLDLFGFQYGNFAYQKISQVFVQEAIPHQISIILNQLISLLVICIKTIPQLTQMIYSTYLLSFCYTATSIISRITRIARYLLLLFYPLYISSSPSSFNNSTSQSNNITSSHIWHTILRYQLEIYLVQAAAFFPVSSPISITHQTNDIQLTNDLGDFLPPKIQSSILIHSNPTTPLTSKQIPSSIKSSKSASSQRLSSQSSTQQYLKHFQTVLPFIKHPLLSLSKFKNPKLSSPLPIVSSVLSPSASHFDHKSNQTKKENNKNYEPQLPLVAFTAQLKSFVSQLINNPFPYNFPISTNSTMSNNDISTTCINLDPTPLSPLLSLRYSQAQEILLYLLSIDQQSNPTRTPVDSPFKDFLTQYSLQPNNQRLISTLYDPNLSKYISPEATNTQFPYHWYIFASSLLFLQSATSTSHISDSLKTSDSFQNSFVNNKLYDWIQSTHDLIQPQLAHFHNQSSASTSSSYSSALETISTTPSTPHNPDLSSISILSYIESKMSYKKYRSKAPTQSSQNAPLSSQSTPIINPSNQTKQFILPLTTTLATSISTGPQILSTTCKNDAQIESHLLKEKDHLPQQQLSVSLQKKSTRIQPKLTLDKNILPQTALSQPTSETAFSTISSTKLSPITQKLAQILPLEKFKLQKAAKLNSTTSSDLQPSLKSSEQLQQRNQLYRETNHSSSTSNNHNSLNSIKKPKLATSPPSNPFLSILPSSKNCKQTNIARKKEL